MFLDPVTGLARLVGTKMTGKLVAQAVPEPNIFEEKMCSH